VFLEVSEFYQLPHGAIMPQYKINVFMLSVWPTYMDEIPWFRGFALYEGINDSLGES
jgi:hypothetical protein